MKKRRINRNPFALIAGKQLVGESDAAAIEFPLLTCLDAAKRGAATGRQSNTIAQHVLQATVIWARMGNRALYDEAVAAWDAISRACARPTEALDLTTGEYKAIRKALGHYIRALPRLEVALLSYACMTAVAAMEK